MDLEESCGIPGQHVALAFDPSPNIPAAAQLALAKQRLRQDNSAS
jgi:hypothetical protein